MLNNEHLSVQYESGIQLGEHATVKITEKIIRIKEKSIENVSGGGAFVSLCVELAVVVLARRIIGESVIGK